MLKPELLRSLKDYSGKKFISDVSAGVIVGVVAPFLDSLNYLVQIFLIQKP